MAITGPASEALSEMLRQLPNPPVTAIRLVRLLTEEGRDPVYAAACDELVEGLRAQGAQIPEHPEEELEWLREHLRWAADLTDLMTLSRMLAALNDGEQE